ncbi:MAG TPA: branched-chain amino acid transaminase [Dehalococcoidia bacterium]|nr:branched-chain amino acid transaminase [Dehalococcoidia bacterium]
MADSTFGKYVWMDGKLVPWAEATVHVSLLGWSTMSGIFEGIKAYRDPSTGGLNAWQFHEHYRRFAASMKLMRMQPEFGPDDLVRASIDLIRANECRDDTYIRPIGYFEATWFGAMDDCRTRIVICTESFTSRFGAGRTLDVCVSSWTRVSDNALSPRIKCISNYQNSRLALVDARLAGYDSAIFLNAAGKVAEGPASCLFLARDGVLITPTVTSGILESITRAAIIRIAREALDLPVVEREVDRTELYIADEIFFCGTGAEIAAISSVDRHPVGEGRIGPITSRIEDLYHKLVRAQDPRYPEWRLPVDEGVGSRVSGVEENLTPDPVS